MKVERDILQSSYIDIMRGYVQNYSAQVQCVAQVYNNRQGLVCDLILMHAALNVGYFAVSNVDRSIVLSNCYNSMMSYAPANRALLIHFLLALNKPKNQDIHAK